MADWRFKAQYLKNCNCIASCPCDTVGLPYPEKGCEGVAAWKVTEGSYDGTSLDGLKFGAVVQWPGALHEGNGTAVPFIDESATETQREFVFKLMSGDLGGPLFDILSEVISTVKDPVFAPVTFEFDKAARTAKLSVPGLLETESEPLKVPATGDLQRVVVAMPDGFEYKEMEVALTKSLKTTGAITMDHPGRHSSLAEVEHTPDGLVA